MKNFVENLLNLVKNMMQNLAKMPMLKWVKQEKQGGGRYVVES
jgi:hypothetical protein